MLTLIEMAKGALMIYFSIMEQTGKTKEEAKAFFDKQYETFKKNRPEDLPDV